MQKRKISHSILASYYNLVNRNTLPADCGILQLAVSSAGLNLPLSPVQKLILALSEVGRNERSCRIRISQPDLLEALRTLTETNNSEAGVWFPPDARVFARKNKVDVEFTSPVKTLLIIAGRRGGKTTLGSLIMTWLARKILLDDSFLRDIPIFKGSSLSLLNTACEIDQGKIFFNMLKNNLIGLGLISGRSSGTERIELKGGKLIIELLSSNARSARGRTAAGVCLDEFAHFQRTFGPMADRTMWNAIIPSLATLGKKSIAVIATTPAGQSGIVWDLFQQRGQRDGMLVIKAPAWVINPGISRRSLEDEFLRDEHMARQEYAADFLAPQGAFLKREEIERCVTLPPCPTVKSRWHIHVDIGLIHDRTAIVAGYISNQQDDEENVCVVVSHVEVINPEKGKPVSLQDIENRIINLAGKIPPHSSCEVTFDQHQSAYLIERLKTAGIRASAVNITFAINQESYNTLRELILSKRIIFPRHEELLNELCNLQYVPSQSGFRVEAGMGSHDDIADAVAICAWKLFMKSLDTQWQDMFDIVEGG